MSSYQPTTIAEWEAALADSEHGELMVQLSNRHGGAGTNWIAGSKLLGFKEGKAVVLPRGHKRTELLPISDLKLWTKGNGRLAELRGKDASAGTIRAPTRKSLIPDDDLYVVYCEATKKYLGGKKLGQWDVYRTLEGARRYLNHGSATAGRYAYLQTNWGKNHRDFTYAYWTVREAKEHEAKVAAAKAEKDRAWQEHVAQEKAERDARTAELAASIVAKVLPAEAEPDPQPEAIPAPLEPIAVVQAPAPAQPVQQTLPGIPVAACAECFSRWKDARRDEGEAEAMLMEARAKRLRAETDLDIDRMRRALAIA